MAKRASASCTSPSSRSLTHTHPRHIITPMTCVDALQEVELALDVSDGLL